MSALFSRTILFSFFSFSVAFSVGPTLVPDDYVGYSQKNLFELENFEILEKFESVKGENKHTARECADACNANSRCSAFVYSWAWGPNAPPPATWPEYIDYICTLYALSAEEVARVKGSVSGRAVRAYLPFTAFKQTSNPIIPISGGALIVQEPIATITSGASEVPQESGTQNANQSASGGGVSVWKRLILFLAAFSD